MAAIVLALAAAAMGHTDMILIAAVFTLGLAQLVFMASADTEFSSQMMREIKQLRDRVAHLEVMPLQLPETLSNSPSRSAPSAADARMAARMENTAAPGLFTEQLDFYLEPVIDLGSGRTAHYRASLMMRMPGGVRFGMDSVRRGAERAGVGAQLEALNLARALPVLSKLRERGRDASIFVPVTADSLADVSFMDRVLELAGMQNEMISRVVLDVDAANLSGLDSEPMRGLQRLAGMGFGFCLSGLRDGQGPQPALLEKLGFCFLAVDAKLIDAGVFANYIRACREMGIEVIAAQVDDADMLIGLPDKASLGFGSLFAQPRLVRQDQPLSAAAA